MSQLPSYFLPRPPMATDAVTIAAFDRLLDEAAGSNGGTLECGLAAPLWQFLCYVADHKQILLHGSPNPDITLFEPRQSDDVSAFGDQKGLFRAMRHLRAAGTAEAGRQGRVRAAVGEQSTGATAGEAGRGAPEEFPFLHQCADTTMSRLSPEPAPTPMTSRGLRKLSARSPTHNF